MDRAAVSRSLCVILPFLFLSMSWKTCNAWDLAGLKLAIGWGTTRRVKAIVEPFPPRDIGRSRVLSGRLLGSWLLKAMVMDA